MSNLPSRMAETESEDADRFLSAVDEVTRAIEGLRSGAVKPEDTDGLLQSLRADGFGPEDDEHLAGSAGGAAGSTAAASAPRLSYRGGRAPPTAEELKAAAEAKAEADRKEVERTGRAGTGMAEGTEWYCRRCRWEYICKDMALVTAYAGEPVQPSSSPAPQGGQCASSASSSEADGADADGARGDGGKAVSDKCPRCRSCPLQSGTARREELQAKVEELKEERGRRAQRRARFTEWSQLRKTAAASSSSTVVTAAFPLPSAPSSSSSSSASSSAAAGAASGQLRQSISSQYELWDFWEPESDADDENDVAGAGGQGNAAFAAMEADMERRRLAKQQQRAAALVHKTRGNELFKQGRYRAAIRAYSAGVDVYRSEKALYTNRAACHLRLGEVAEAIKDCNTVADMFKYLDDSKLDQQDRTSASPIVVKALLRRATARQCMRE